MLHNKKNQSMLDMGEYSLTILFWKQTETVYTVPILRVERISCHSFTPNEIAPQVDHVRSTHKLALWHVLLTIVAWEMQ